MERRGMTDTQTAEQLDLTAPKEAPAPQLPAVRQEHAPRKPKAESVPQFSAHIAASILSITRVIERVQKKGENEFQHYKYMRWEDINEQLAPLLADHGLIIVQSEQSRSLLEEND